MDKRNRRYLRKYRREIGAPQGLVLDIGGFDVNGTINSCFRHQDGYISLDIVAGDNVDVRADAHILPFRDNSFAEVVTLSTAQYLKNPFKVMSEIYRVLIPSGVVFFEAPSQETPGLVGDHWEDALACDSFRYFPKGVRCMFEEAGFERIYFCRMVGNTCWGVARKGEQCEGYYLYRSENG